ncbi:hypothetical protein A9Q84_17835 [Halobacteriovorax marinus]|uniref:Lipoprotein n=1 Tax=Halobacteriovorax marinus TaxID=97084 RepID=A0A1Y5F3B7_9BACT|nr:hypothetical protein A9Q84_17835 [Halobacteriovorax marinus]
MKSLFLCIFISLSFNLQASELDSLTRRYEPLKDSTDFFNAEINSRILRVVAKANKKDLNGESCNPKSLLKSTRNILVAGISGMYIFSPLQKIVDSKKSVGFERLRTKHKESIYRFIKFYQKPVLKAFPLSPIIKINDVIIGGDKFSHFFNLGYEYFSKLQKGKKTLIEMLEHSRSVEEHFWGGPTTSVISMGDLSTNYQGLRFFGHLTGVGIDPLTGEANSKNPIVTCVDGEFVQSRLFDLRSYVDHAWDEGINCNNYHKVKYADLVTLAVNTLEESSPKGFACPVRPTDCKKLGRKYQLHGEFFLHAMCL